MNIVFIWGTLLKHFLIFFHLKWRHVWFRFVSLCFQQEAFHSALYSFTRSATSPLTPGALILLEPIRAAAWRWTSLTQRVRRHQTNQPITRSKFQWLNQPVSQQGPDQENQQSRKKNDICEIQQDGKNSQSVQFFGIFASLNVFESFAMEESISSWLCSGVFSYVQSSFYSLKEETIGRLKLFEFCFLLFS